MEPIPSISGVWREKTACRIATLPIVPLFAKVLTVSDSVFAGTRQDVSGPAIAARLEQAGFSVTERRVAPDGVIDLATVIVEMARGFRGLVVTTGGTGFAPRDTTPEATLSVVDRQAPGLAEAMRAVSPLGRLSRGAAGTFGESLILNTPGSIKGAIESLDAVLDVVPHALELLAGGRPH
jgi:molybdopterin adenylyltransferase